MQSIPSQHMPPSVNILQGQCSTERPRYFLQFFSQKSSVHDNKNRWMGSITLISLKSLIILCELSQLLPLEYFFSVPPPKEISTRYRLVLITWPGAQGSQGIFLQGLTGSGLVLLPSAASPWTTFDSPSPGENSLFLGHTHSFLLTLRHFHVHSLMLIAPSASGVQHKTVGTFPIICLSPNNLQFSMGRSRCTVFYRLPSLAC